MSLSDVTAAWNDGNALSEGTAGHREKAEGGIENLISPRLKKYKYGKCIAIFSLLAQVVLFCMMITYYMEWSCELEFTTIDADWDKSAYAPYFERNIKLCSSNINQPIDKWFDDVSEEVQDILNGMYGQYDDAKALEYRWINCHLVGHTCSQYDKSKICETDYLSNPFCDEDVLCYGNVSLRYAVCKSFGEAVPLAIGYLVYANMMIVVLCVLCCCMWQFLTCNGKDAMSEAKYQIVGVIAKGDETVVHVKDDGRAKAKGGDIEMEDSADITLETPVES